MRKQVIDHIHREKLLEAGDSVVVAVSGGADSMALIHLLQSLSDLKLRLIIAHLNHKLRGDEAEEDARFVSSYGFRHNVPVEVDEVDVAALARGKCLSLEEAGREARYMFLGNVAKKHQASRIALAHHADDQAETVLMMLIRGAGSAGLRGMLPKDGGGTIVRPLLCVTRKEIEYYVKKHGIEYRTDSTNMDVRFLRNRIRHELLPLLQEYNPAIIDRLSATSRILAADDAVLSQITKDVLSRAVTVSCNTAEVDLSLLCGLDDGVRFRLYRSIIQSVKGDLRAVGYDHIQAIDNLVSVPRSRGRIALPGGISIKRRYDTLMVAAGEKEYGEYQIQLEGPGCYSLPGGGELSVEVVPPPVSLVTPSPDIAYFDTAKAPFPWIVRTARPGDRFVPFGMSGRKKIKDVFIDCKIPQDLRRRIPLVFSRNGIIWVGGVRAGALGAVQGPVDRVIKAVLSGVEVLK